MAGYVIHLAIGQEYLKKHPEIKNKEEFLEGIIYPDLVQDKSTTHFGIDARRTSLQRFLRAKSINTPRDLGHFLHLVTDYYFYNQYLKDVNWEEVGNKLYNDYDVLNEHLIKQYNIIVPANVRECVKFKSGDLNYLTTSGITDFIKRISSLDLVKLKSDIQTRGEER